MTHSPPPARSSAQRQAAYRARKRARGVVRLPDADAVTAAYLQTIAKQDGTTVTDALRKIVTAEIARRIPGLG